MGVSPPCGKSDSGEETAQSLKQEEFDSFAVPQLVMVCVTYLKLHGQYR